MSSDQPDSLYLGRVDFKAADGSLKWTQLTSITLATSLKIDLETFQCPDETEYESLLVCWNAEVDGEKMPLIVYPHGGFHSAHSSLTSADFYKAVSARNPVIDMATMFPITDIADWTIVESQLGQGGELEKLLNPGTLSRMWEMPPIRYVDQVKAPVLLLVGKVDLRISPTRANEYYRALKVHGKKVKQVQLLSL